MAKESKKRSAQAITFENSSIGLKVFGLFWLLELIVAVAFLFGGFYFASQDPIFGLVISGTAAFLLFTSIAFLSDVRFRLFDAQPTIVVSSEGFLDRRLSREPIPWDEIAAIPYYWYRQRSLAVILKDPANPRLNPIFALKFQEWLGKLLNMPGYPVILSGNNAEVPSLEDAIRKFAPGLVRPA